MRAVRYYKAGYEELLRNILKDIAMGDFPKTVSGVEKRYLFEQYFGDHPRYVALSLRFQGRYSMWAEECYVEKEQYEFLARFNPAVHLGEVAGKHSDVWEEFNRLVEGVERNRCVVRMYVLESSTCWYLEDAVNNMKRDDEERLGRTFGSLKEYMKWKTECQDGGEECVTDEE